LQAAKLFKCFARPVFEAIRKSNDYFDHAQSTQLGWKRVVLKGAEKKEKAQSPVFMAIRQCPQLLGFIKIAECR
jgi:fatty acid/phospholipid biosynthesis enzyme